LPFLLNFFYEYKIFELKLTYMAYMFKKIFTSSLESLNKPRKTPK